MKRIGILIAFFSSYSLIAMDADCKKESDQIQQESHPAQALIKDEIVRADVLPKVLAPMIAEYAENPYKGNIFIQDMPAENISLYESSDYGKRLLEFYKKKFSELFSKLTQKSLLIKREFDLKNL